MKLDRINTFGEVLRDRFPFKVRKIGVDAGFTCPNRDGTKARGGCVYCNNRSFSSNADTRESLQTQIQRGIELAKLRRIHHYIVYFQAYTNTYASTDRLRELYEIALGFPGVVGLSIGTRPDCLSDTTIELISELAERVSIWLEIGLESSHDRSLRWMNRAQTFSEFEDAARRTAHRSFDRVVHTIYGVPGESHADMMSTTDRIAEFGFDSIKIHNLYVAEGTPLAAMYRKGEIRVYTLDEWIPLAADIVERLPQSMTVQRICGEHSHASVLAPRWGKSATEILGYVDQELARRGTRQGSRISPPALLKSRPAR